MKYNPDSPLLRFMTKLADLMILNILFMVTCLPVVTIGASLTGMYYVTLKMIRNEEGGISRSYLRSFRQNFRQATVIWLCILAFAALVFVDVRIADAVTDDSANGVIRALTGLVAALSLMVVQYIFPGLAKFETGTFSAVKNAWIMALGNLPQSVIMLVFSAGMVYVTFLNDYTLTIGALVWIMLGFSGMALCKSSFLVKIFDKYIPGSKPENSEE